MSQVYRCQIFRAQKDEDFGQTIGDALGEILESMREYPRKLLVVAHAAIMLGDFRNDAEDAFIDFGYEVVKAWEAHDIDLESKCQAVQAAREATS